VKKQVLKLNGLGKEGDVKSGGIFGVYVFQEISPCTIAKLRDPGTDFFWV
jgi:hypothetical protein